MAEVKVLVEGIHEKIEGAIDIYSTSTLIKSNINIIVDPGSFVSRDKLVQALDQAGLKIEDIDAVIVTHSHFDHTANVSLFPQAKIYMRFISGVYPGQYQKIDKGLVYRFDILNELIAEGIKILDTTGHAIDHISVLVETSQGRIVIAGDAMANQSFADLNKEPENFLIYSLEKYNESRRKILEIADYIIPGHGVMFKVEK